MHLTPTALGEHVARAALDSASVSPEHIDHVVFGMPYTLSIDHSNLSLGNVVQAVKDAAYLARGVGLRIGVPVDRPAVTVNRLCGTGFEAIIEAARVDQSLKTHLLVRSALANYCWR